MTLPSFSVGEDLTAADMNAVGLWKITPTVTSSGGTAATVSDGVVSVGNGNTSVTITAFNATYANYLIVVEYLLANTGNPGLFLKMGTAATAYYGVTAYWAYDTSGDSTVKRNNGTEWNLGYVGANNYSASINIYSPNRTVRTSYTATFAGDLYNGTSSGMLANATSYTAFNLAPSSGSFTQGTIRVYGYRN